MLLARLLKGDISQTIPVIFARSFVLGRPVIIIIDTHICFILISETLILPTIYRSLKTWSESKTQ